MKIESSTIGLASQHTSFRQVTVKESLRAWAGPQRPDFEGRAAENRAALQSTVATISDAARQAAAHARTTVDAAAPAKTRNDSGVEDAAEQARNNPKLQVIIGMIEALTGKKVRLFNPNELKHDDAAHPRSGHAAQPHAPPAAEPAQREGWGMEYDRHETIHESEQTSFSAEGIVRTSDGKEIRFQLSLEMSREFFQESNLSIRAGDAVRKDPLVINFDGNAAQLTDTKFDFDIDSDGEADSISFVGTGSGFLALDKNGSGVIDNGSELFGTQSGNGFADLAAYDEDGNNWIDENDAVYSKLQIWSKNAGGQDTLSTLAQRNIGALYLGNVATPFDLKNSSNDLQGQIRSSGIFLSENGSVGTMQQIDLLV